MIAILSYPVHFFFILLCMVLCTPPFPLDVIPCLAGPGISAVFDNTLDLVSVTLCRFLDWALECDGLGRKIRIIIREP